MSKPFNRDEMHAPDQPIWETWDSMFIKTTALGNIIRSDSLEKQAPIQKLAVIPRGGLYLAILHSRMLGLDGVEVLNVAVSKYKRDHPTHAGQIRVGQIPTREQVEGLHILLVDEVHDTGETVKVAEEIIEGLGAASVQTAAVHAKIKPNETGRLPDHYIELTDGWVHYPWEPIDDSGDIYRQAFANGLTASGLTVPAHALDGPAGSSTITS